MVGIRPGADLFGNNPFDIAIQINRRKLDRMARHYANIEPIQPAAVFNHDWSWMQNFRVSAKAASVIWNIPTLLEAGRYTANGFQLSCQRQ